MNPVYFVQEKKRQNLMYQDMQVWMLDLNTINPQIFNQTC